ncbi:hypothetical protein [Arsenophonus endosymbiont of Aleurodicus floccissimus]|nr:hypothetical protein [Arsenophonus endosymbiont of Aleurodicus floccissimus]
MAGDELTNSKIANVANPVAAVAKKIAIYLSQQHRKSGRHLVQL